MLCSNQSHSANNCFLRFSVSHISVASGFHFSDKTMQIVIFNTKNLTVTVIFKKSLRQILHCYCQIIQHYFLQIFFKAFEI